RDKLVTGVQTCALPISAAGTEVRINEAVTAGRHIRRAGQDFAAGDAVIQAGRRITARDVGLAAAANHPWLTVHRRPRVAILATRSEERRVGEGGRCGWW